MPLESVLSALDDALPTKGNKPAAPKGSLQALTKLLGRAVHPDLGTLWQWGRAALVLEHPALAVAAEERDEWWWSQRWLTAREALAAMQELRELPSFPRMLVPIATDEAGNYSCHDAVTGKLVDWDHETRKTRKLSGSLTTLFKTVLAVLRKERRAAARPPDAAKAPSSAPGDAPTRIRALKSPVLRKLAAGAKSHGFLNAALSPDGKLAAGQVYGTYSLVFGRLGEEAELVPSEPGLETQKSEMGFVLMNAHGIAFDGTNRFVWREGERLSLWSWRDGALSLGSGARWTEGEPNFMDAVPPRLRGARLAVAAIVADQVTIGVWAVDALPKAVSLAEARAERPPEIRLPVMSWEGGELFFDLDETGEIVSLQSPEYLTWLLKRWDGKTGRLLAERRLEDVRVVDVALSPDGSLALVLTDEGELLAFDRTLEPMQRVAAHRGAGRSGSGVRFAPSGELFVTSAEGRDGRPGELCLWKVGSAEPIARLEVKEAKRGFRVRSTGAFGLLTTDPLALFELR